MIKLIKKLGRSNAVVKPAAVLVSSAPAGTFLLTTSKLFNEVEVEGQDLVVITKDLAKSFQGALLLIVLMISIINIYKPSKLITSVLIVGGLMVFAGSLLTTAGTALLLYGLGLLINTLTFDKLIIRNNKLANKKLDLAVDQIIGGNK